VCSRAISGLYGTLHPTPDHASCAPASHWRAQTPARRERRACLPYGWSQQFCPATASRARRSCDGPPAVRGRLPGAAPDDASRARPVAESGVPPNRRTAHGRWPPSRRAQRPGGWCGGPWRRSGARTDGRTHARTGTCCRPGRAGRRTRRRAWPLGSKRPAPTHWTRQRPTGSASQRYAPAGSRRPARVAVALVADGVGGRPGGVTSARRWPRRSRPSRPAPVIRRGTASRSVPPRTFRCPGRSRSAPRSSSGAPRGPRNPG
jgi:hypothetical protein